MAEHEAIRSGFLERTLHSGPVTLGGLALLIVSFFLIIAWTDIAARHRRLPLRLGCAAVSLAVIGYLVYDWQHVSLNFSMRDAPMVRNDCVQLLERRRATVEDDFMDWNLSGQDIPASFSRMGCKFIRVTRSNVQICLHTDGNGGAWGFLYDPNRSYLATRWPDDVRAAWSRDFTSSECAANESKQQTAYAQ
jgi:hypothetical protein